MNMTIPDGKQSAFIGSLNPGFEEVRNLTKSLTFTSQAIEPACSIDIQSLVRLASANVPQVASNTVWEIPWTWKYYRVVRDPTNRIIGAGALLPLNDSLAEIRGLVVSDSSRGTGIATRIVEHLLSWANALEMDAVCVTRKPGFFRKFGFQETNPAWLDLQRNPKLVPRNSNYPVSQALAPRVAMALAG